jgi:hypothetical protein
MSMATVDVRLVALTWPSFGDAATMVAASRATDSECST